MVGRKHLILHSHPTTKKSKENVDSRELRRQTKLASRWRLSCASNVEQV